VQLAFHLLGQDLAQIHPRTTRDELGDQLKGALVASPLEPYDIEFSRGGFANPVGLPRGTVLRVAYNREAAKLARYYWPATDVQLTTTQCRGVLLKGVISFEMTFLTPDGEGHRDWPPLNTQNQPAAQAVTNLSMLPRAVRSGVELEDLGTIW